MKRREFYFKGTLKFFDEVQLKTFYKKWFALILKRSFNIG